LEVWRKLAEKQQASGTRRFPITQPLLNELGFTRKDFHDNTRELQVVLDKIQDCRLSWDENKTLSDKCDPPTGQIDYTLVIGREFADAYIAFMDYSKNKTETNSE
jgi:hypothetical protein